MCLELQLAQLTLMQQIYPDNEQFAQDLRDIQMEVTPQETDEEKQKREEAEQRVMLVVLQHGELVGHGDLMTRCAECMAAWQHCCEALFLGKNVNLLHLAEMLRITRFVAFCLKCRDFPRHKMFATRHLKLFCTPTLQSPQSPQSLQYLQSPKSP